MSGKARVAMVYGVIEMNGEGIDMKQNDREKGQQSGE